MFFFQFASITKARQFDAVVNHATGLHCELSGINCTIMNLFTRTGHRVHVEWLESKANQINA